MTTLPFSCVTWLIHMWLSLTWLVCVWCVVLCDSLWTWYSISREHHVTNRGFFFNVTLCVMTRSLFAAWQIQTWRVCARSVLLRLCSSHTLSLLRARIHSLSLSLGLWAVQKLRSWQRPCSNTCPYYVVQLQTPRLRRSYKNNIKKTIKIVPLLSFFQHHHFTVVGHLPHITKGGGEVFGRVLVQHKLAPLWTWRPLACSISRPALLSHSFSLSLSVSLSLVVSLSLFLSLSIFPYPIVLCNRTTRSLHILPLAFCFSQPPPSFQHTETPSRTSVSSSHPSSSTSFFLSFFRSETQTMSIRTQESAPDHSLSTYQQPSL